MEDLKKMLGKKNKNSNPAKKEAKVNALKGLRSEMSDMMKGGLSDKMNKVTVAAKDKDGLKKGLSKAEDMLEAMPPDEEAVKKRRDMSGGDEAKDLESLGSLESNSEDDSEESEERSSIEEACEEMSDQELDGTIQKLVNMKKKRQY